MMIFKIKSKFRFFTFLIVFIAGVSIALSAGFGMLTVHGAEIVNYPEIKVVSGQTLWDIANASKPADMDTREAVYIIKKHNNLKDSFINENMTLVIPFEAE